jgi:hypothetical protein
VSSKPVSPEDDGIVRVTYDVKITPKLVAAIVAPYAWDKLLEQIKAIAPISLFLFFFQMAVLRQGIVTAVTVTLGLSAVILGLMFFIEGIRLGAMPLGENIGATLPEKATLTVILTAAFLLGTIATFAEPAIATLTVLGGNIPYERAPLLYDFLNQRTTLLLFLAAAGVGLGAINGIVRFIKGRSLKVTVLPGLAVTVVLTLIAAFDPKARDLIGVAWDAGGITTGTVTAPLVLALGVGMAKVLGKGDSGMSGFGIITLCSIWPIALVLAAALICSWTGNYMSPAEYAALAASKGAAAEAGSINVIALFGESFLGAATSLLPLIGLLFLIQWVILKEKVRNLDQVIMGVIFALLGLLLFKVGLVTGLTPLGEQGHPGLRPQRRPLRDHLGQAHRAALRLPGRLRRLPGRARAGEPGHHRGGGHRGRLQEMAGHALGGLRGGPGPHHRHRPHHVGLVLAGDRAAQLRDRPAAHGHQRREVREHRLGQRGGDHRGHHLAHPHRAGPGRGRRRGRRRRLLPHRHGLGVAHHFGAGAGPLRPAHHPERERCARPGGRELRKLGGSDSG